MSHGDRLEQAPPGFVGIGHTEGSTLAAMRHNAKPIMESSSSRSGAHAQRRGDARDFCFASPGFGRLDVRSFVETSLESIRTRVGDAGC